MPKNDSLLSPPMVASLCLLAVTIADPGATVAAPPRAVEPLERVLLNMPAATNEQDVRAIAKGQAHPSTGPRYPDSTPPPGDDASQREPVWFQGYFVPASDDSKLSVFSDDGVDVQITTSAGVTTTPHSAEGTGQHLPNLGQSFHTVDYDFTANEVYYIRIVYSNTMYTGNWDVDGCTLFAWNGGGSIGEAELDIDVDALARHLTDNWPPVGPDHALAEHEDSIETSVGLHMPVTDPDLPDDALPDEFPGTNDTYKELRVDLETDYAGILTFSGMGSHLGVYRLEGDGKQHRVTTVDVPASGVDGETFYLHTSEGFTESVTLTATFAATGSPTGHTPVVDEVSIHLLGGTGSYSLYVNGPATDDDYVGVEAIRVPITVTWSGSDDDDRFLKLADVSGGDDDEKVRFYTNETGNDDFRDGETFREFVLLGDGSATFWISVNEAGQDRTIRLTTQADETTSLAEVTVEPIELFLQRSTGNWSGVSGHANAGGEIDRPEPGSTVAFIAAIYGASNVPGTVEFLLVDTSDRPGITMNFNHVVLDSRKDFTFQTQAHHEAPSDEGQSIREDGSDGVLGGAPVWVTANDYGPTGSIKARFYLPTGRLIAESSSLTVLRDENDNGIEDAWDNAFAGSTEADADGDSTPAGEGTDGELLTRFEEYRGFVVLEGGERRYASLDPGKKDVFLWDNLGHDFDDGGHGLTLFAGLGSGMYMVDGDLVQGRKINFNGGTTDQQALKVDGVGLANSDDGGTDGDPGVSLGDPPSDNQYNRVYIALHTRGAVRLAADITADQDHIFYDASTDDNVTVLWLEDGHVRITDANDEFEIFQYETSHPPRSDYAETDTVAPGVPADSQSIIVDDLPAAGFNTVMIGNEALVYRGDTIPRDGYELSAAITDDDELDELDTDFATVTPPPEGKYYYVRIGTPPAHEWVSYTGAEGIVGGIRLTGVVRERLGTAARAFDAETPIRIPRQFVADRGAFDTTAAAVGAGEHVTPVGVWEECTRGVAGMQNAHVAMTHQPIHYSAYVDTIIRLTAAHEATHACAEEDVEHFANSIMSSGIYTRGGREGNGFHTNYRDETKEQFIAR